MLKTKNGPALFEVLHKAGKDPVAETRVPTWWNRTEQAQNPGPGLDRPTEPLRIVQQSSPRVADAKPRFAEFDGATLRLSLTSRSGALAAFVAVVVLAGFFAIGRRSGTNEGLRRSYEAANAAALELETPSDELAQARMQPPSTELIRDLLPKGQQPERSVGQVPATIPTPARPGPIGAWTKGHTYIVAQEFTANAAGDAQKVQDYMADFGVPTAIIRVGNGAAQLITTEGFNMKEPSQKKLAEQRRDAIHKIGDKYAAAGGRYGLKGYFKTLTNDNW